MCTPFVIQNARTRLVENNKRSWPAPVAYFFSFAQQIGSDDVLFLARAAIRLRLLALFRSRSQSAPIACSSSLAQPYCSDCLLFITRAADRFRLRARCLTAHRHFDSTIQMEQLHAFVQNSQFPPLLPTRVSLVVRIYKAKPPIQWNALRPRKS
jgi:hypothetical protein